jgi:hypothetical protein
MESVKESTVDNGRFDSMYRAIIGAGVVIAVAIVGAPHF